MVLRFFFLLRIVQFKTNNYFLSCSHGAYVIIGTPSLLHHTSLEQECSHQTLSRPTSNLHRELAHIPSLTTLTSYKYGCWWR